MLTTWPASVVDAGSGGDMSLALTSWSLHAGKKIMLASHMNERLSWKKHPGYLGLKHKGQPSLGRWQWAP